MVDTDAAAYSVEVLRSLKRIREELAAREAQPRVDQLDLSSCLIELPHVQTTYRLFEVILPQGYTFATTNAIRELLRGSKSPSELLDLAAEVIPGVWESHPNVVGILSTLLSTVVDLWQPTPRVLAKLETLCEGAVASGDWSLVASVEPLAFALGAKGCRDLHKSVLERLIEERHWREADSERIRAYYGTAGNEIAAIVRHWHDPYRAGLLRANDIGRLIDLLLSRDRVLQGSRTQGTLIRLLKEHGRMLAEYGEVHLAQQVDDLVKAFEQMKSPHLSSTSETDPIGRTGTLE